MIKVLPWRFQQFVDSFSILLLKGSSEMRFFRHLSQPRLSQSVTSEIHKLRESSFLKKCSKFNLNLKNAEIK